MNEQLLKDENEAKFWLYPDVHVAYNHDYDIRTLRDLLDVVEKNKELIEKAWNDFFR